MYREGDTLVLSPSDLVGYLHCGHLTELSLAVSRGELAKPTEVDADLGVVQKRGLAHEERYLGRLREEGLAVAVIDPKTPFDAQVADTLRALRAGPDIIYQAAFLAADGESPGWRGHADFLRRTARPSELGDFSYEPEDTKLAHVVRPSAVVQLCDYATHLTRLQGTAPESIHVVLGGDRTETLRLKDYDAYYRAAKVRFEGAIAAVVPVYPDPVSFCAVCAWREACDQRRVHDDHLSLVANIRGDQIRKLHNARIATVADLAGAGGASVPGMVPATFDKLRSQARLQVAARLGPAGPPPYELLPDPGEGRGLGALPPPSPGDLYFDIEGDPFEGDKGLEYLLGVGWVEGDGTFAYREFWSHTPDEERRSFEEFMDFIGDRQRSHPDLHVYHYAPYEPTALGRLMGRYATREEEVDGLFRAGTLVDLLQVVRQSVRVGTPSYGLKKIESLYMTPRTAEITDGGSSIVEYERWLEDHDPEILRSLAAYNKEDCESTWLLHRWLEARRVEYGETFGAPPARPTVREAEASANVAEAVAVTAALSEALVQGAGSETGAAAASLLLGHLLDWHRRDAKPGHWRYYDRVLRCEGDDLFADTEAVADLTFEREVEQVARSMVYRYRFDPTQDHKLKRNEVWCDPDTERARLLGRSVPSGPSTIVDVDPVAGTVDLKRSLASGAPHPRHLIPGGPLRTDAQREALLRVGRSALANGIDGPGPYRAVRDLLLRRPPRLAAAPSGAALCRQGEQPDHAVVRLAGELDGGTLAVQGPPGSGKTRTAARTIVELVEAGHRVGVTANSHAVITNLLRDVVAHGEKVGRPVSISQKSDGDKGLDHPWVTVRSDNAQMAADLTTADVLAGTGWLFCRPEFDQSLHTMVVDEAGQLSLANVVAVGTAARNLILVGDPNQLAQPSQGTHPPGADVSGLEHVIGEADTMPADLGLFLDHTHRLHPDICHYISEVFYDGRLTSLPGCELQVIGGAGPLRGSGLRFVPVAHEGNRSSSVEEAEAVAALVDELVDRPWTDRAGNEAALTRADLLVVAPYNAQVTLLAKVIGPGTPVGTVDRFQGQQAAVVITSLAASRAEDVPRGLDFLYSRHRLNVAVSRARCLSILVASPALLAAECHTVQQMRLVNGLCRFVELAETVPLRR